MNSFFPRTSDVETARFDKRCIDFKWVRYYEDGSPSVDTLRRFAESLPLDRRKGLIDSEGVPARTGEIRFNAAVLAKVYDSEPLVHWMSLALEPDADYLMKALLLSAADMHRLLEVGAPYDVRPLIVRTAVKTLTALRSGANLWEHALQRSLFELDSEDADAVILVRAFAEHLGSPGKLASKLRRLADLCCGEAQRTKHTDPKDNPETTATDMHFLLISSLLPQSPAEPNPQP